MLAEIRQREGVIVIRPTGRMIGAANAEIREQINEELEEHFDSQRLSLTSRMLPVWTVVVSARWYL